MVDEGWAHRTVPELLVLVYFMSFMLPMVCSNCCRNDVSHSDIMPRLSRKAIISCVFSKVSNFLQVTMLFVCNNSLIEENSSVVSPCEMASRFSEYLFGKSGYFLHRYLEVFPALRFLFILYILGCGIPED
jgi:hypothetical protein